MSAVIHPTVQIFGDKFKCGRNVRIDCFCVISGDVEIGDNVHIGVQACLFGSSGKIRIGSHAGVGVGSTIFTATDDLVGPYLGGGPCEPPEYRNVITGNVTIEDGACITTRCVILPGVTIGRGSAVGALTLVKKDVEPYSIVVGHNQRVIGYRNRDEIERLLEKAAQNNI